MINEVRLAAGVILVNNKGNYKKAIEEVDRRIADLQKAKVILSE